MSDWTPRRVHYGEWLVGERIKHDGFILIRNQNEVFSTIHDGRFKVVVFVSKRQAYGAAKRLNNAQRSLSEETESKHNENPTDLQHR